MLDPWKLTMLSKLSALGTMSNVASAMHLSTSTVSQQLAALELEVGLQLIEHSGRNVRLTPAGKEVVSVSSAALDELGSVQDFIAGERDTPKGSIRLSTFASALPAIVIPALTALARKYPDISVEVLEEEPDTSLPLLAAGQRDVAITARFAPEISMPKNTQVTSQILTDELYAVLPVGHSLAERTEIGFADLSTQSWALEPEHTYLHRYIRSHCEVAGYIPRVVATLQSHASMLDAVASGLCITVLPRLALTQDKRERSELTYLGITPAAERHIVAITTPRQNRRQAVRKLIAALHAIAPHTIRD